jgi:hypothetical protein
VFADQTKSLFGDQFAGRQAGAEMRLQLTQQAHRECRRADGQPGGHRCPRQGEEFQDGGGDDSEGALGADEQMLEVITGIVLAQAAQAIPDLPARQNHLQAERQFTCVAVAQDLHTTGVGRQIAADLTTALGGQRQRKQSSDLAGCLLQCLQHAAGLGGQRVVRGIDRAHTAEPGKADQHRLTVRRRRCRAAQAGVAALRHHRHASLGAGAYHRRDGGGACRSDDADGVATVATAPVAQVCGHVFERRQHLLGADNLGELCDQVRMLHRQSLDVNRRPAGKADPESTAGNTAPGQQ